MAKKKDMVYFIHWIMFIWAIGKMDNMMDMVH